MLSRCSIRRLKIYPGFKTHGRYYPKSTIGVLPDSKTTKGVILSKYLVSITGKLNMKQKRRKGRYIHPFSDGKKKTPEMVGWNFVAEK